MSAYSSQPSLVRGNVEHFVGVITAAAQRTASTGRLREIEQYPAGRILYTRFNNFTAGDADGQNLSGKATQAACRWITERLPAIERYFSNRAAGPRRLDGAAIGRDTSGMLAGAVTLWVTFSVVLVAPALRLSVPVRTAAAGLLMLELAAMLVASYGCEPACTALAGAAGTAARVDIPALTAIFLAVATAAALHARRIPEPDH